MSVRTWIGWSVDSIHTSRLLTWIEEICHLLVRWKLLEASWSLFSGTASRIYLRINSGITLWLRILHLIHNSWSVIQPASTSSTFISGAQIVEKFWYLRTLRKFRKLTKLSVAHIWLGHTSTISSRACVVENFLHLRVLAVKIKIFIISDFQIDNWIDLVLLF